MTEWWTWGILVVTDQQHLPTPQALPFLLVHVFCSGLKWSAVLRIAVVPDADAKLKHFPRCGLLQNKNEVLCLLLVIRYLSDYAGSGVQLGSNRGDPLRNAHKISFSSLGMLLQMVVCRGVWNWSCSTESSDLTFCNTNFNKLAALDFPVLFLAKPALLHGAVVFQKSSFFLWGFRCPIFLAWWNPFEYKLLPSTSNLASSANLLKVHYTMQVIDDIVSFLNHFTFLTSFNPSQTLTFPIPFLLTQMKYHLDLSFGSVARSKHCIDH